MNRRRLLTTLVLLSGVTLVGAATAQAQNNAAIEAVRPLRPAVSGELRTLELPGFGTVRYYASEGGEGRPLILTHSVNAAASTYEMKPLWDAYAGQRPVYSLDWPGFGQSDRPDTRYSAELMSQALLALVAELDAEVDVVSLSLGSEFAARAALEEPRIRSLALISPSGLGEPRGSSQEATQEDGGARAYERLSRFEDPLYGLIRSRPSIHYFLSRSFRGDVPRDLVQYAWESSRQEGAVNAPLYFLSGQLFSRDGYGELYSKLEIPVAVLYDRDAFVSFERLPQFDTKSNVAAVRIPGTDGLPQWEQLDAVTDVLDQFWAQVR